MRFTTIIVCALVCLFIVFVKADEDGSQQSGDNQLESQPQQDSGSDANAENVEETPQDDGNGGDVPEQQDEDSKKKK